MEDSKYFVGQHIRKIRKSLAMSQREFVGLLSPKLHSSLISVWENGRVCPSGKYLQKIAYIGNTTPKALMQPLDTISMDHESAKVLHIIAQPWVVNDNFKHSNPKEYQMIVDIDNQAKEIINNE